MLCIRQTFDVADERLEAEWLLQERGRVTQSVRFRQFCRSAGHEDDGDARPRSAGSQGQVDSVKAPRQIYICYNEFTSSAIQQFNGFIRGVGLYNFETSFAEDLDEDLPHAAFVLHDQNTRHNFPSRFQFNQGVHHMNA
jgi:hypothetical protein